MRHQSGSRPILGALMICGLAQGQSLYEQPVPPADDRSIAGGQAQVIAPDAPLMLEQVSLLAVKPAKPREYTENDLIQIIISERSQVDRKQEAESAKSYSNNFEVEQFIDLVNLLETRIQATSEARLPKISLTSDSDFEGDGEYKREDRFTDRVMARVLEVKPNGTLVLEARRQFITDEEEAVVVLSGICRYEDVTDTNTVQSNQLFDLVLNVQNTGDLKRTTKKGIIPRVLEGILNF